MGKRLRQKLERRRFERLDAWMAANLRADLTVGALADRALMAPRSLVRRYREIRGVYPAKAVERLRIGAAVALLEAVTDQPPGIARIAHAVGFGCTRSFERAFKRQHGLSPAAWIEKRLGRQNMTEEERDELMAQIDQRVMVMSVNLDRQVGLILDRIGEQLDRIERLVGGNPPPRYPPGQDTPPEALLPPGNYDATPQSAKQSQSQSQGAEDDARVQGGGAAQRQQDRAKGQKP